MITAARRFKHLRGSGQAQWLAFTLYQGWCVAANADWTGEDRCNSA
jgi:hypothetical protein